MKNLFSLESVRSIFWRNEIPSENHRQWKEWLKHVASFEEAFRLNLFVYNNTQIVQTTNNEKKMTQMIASNVWHGHRRTGSPNVFWNAGIWMCVVCMFTEHLVTRDQCMLNQKYTRIYTICALIHCVFLFVLFLLHVSFVFLSVFFQFMYWIVGEFWNDIAWWLWQCVRRTFRSTHTHHASDYILKTNFFILNCVCCPCLLIFPSFSRLEKINDGGKQKDRCGCSLSQTTADYQTVELFRKKALSHGERVNKKVKFCMKEKDWNLLQI